jgi:predicted permease
MSCNPLVGLLMVMVAIAVMQLWASRFANRVPSALSFLVACSMGMTAGFGTLMLLVGVTGGCE